MFVEACSSGFRSYLWSLLPKLYQQLSDEPPSRCRTKPLRNVTGRQVHSPLNPCLAPSTKCLHELQQVLELRLKYWLAELPKGPGARSKYDPRFHGYY